MASTPLSTAVLAGGVALMLVAHVLVIFWALRRCRTTNADQEGAAATDQDGGCKGLSADELKTIMCHDFSSNGTAGADCSVCLESFEAGERCRLLPRCDHSFHAKCVDPWLEKSRCCPVCRADVVPSGEVVKVAAEGALAVERSSPAALEMVVTGRRLQQYI